MLSMLLYVIIIENSYNNNNNIQNKVSLSKGSVAQCTQKKKKKEGEMWLTERHKKQNKAPHVSHI